MAAANKFVDNMLGNGIRAEFSNGAMGFYKFDGLIHGDGRRDEGYEVTDQRKVCPAKNGLTSL